MLDFGRTSLKANGINFTEIAKVQAEGFRVEGDEFLSFNDAKDHHCNPLVKFLKIN